MNPAHFHLVLNHFPVIGAFFAFPLLVYAILSKKDLAAQMALGFVVLVSVSAVPAYLTGEGAEDFIEDVEGISSKSVIEEHEEAALPALIVLELAGTAAIGVLLFFRPPRKRPAWALPAVLVLLSVSAGLLSATANLGAHIRHAELDMHAKSGAEKSP